MSVATNKECFAFILKITHKQKKIKSMVFVRKKSHSIKLYGRKSQTPTPQRQPVEGEDCILLDTLYAKNHELHIEGTQ